MSELEMLNAGSEPNRTLQMPSHLPSDYITIAYHCLFVAIGVPLNIYTLVKLISISAASFACFRFSHGRQSSTTSSARFVLLKLHLSISDLMILLFYSVSEAAWTVTYAWHGGDLICRLIHFLKMLAFSVHANVVVTIAIDRVFAVRQMRCITNGASELRRLHAMLAVSWLVAIVCALPQFVVWQVGAPYEEDPEWMQCATIWQFKRSQIKNGTSTKDLGELGYNVAHLVGLFWLPVTTIVGCYTFIFVTLVRCAREQRRKMRGYNTRGLSTTMEQQSSLMVQMSRVETTTTNGRTAPLACLAEDDEQSREKLQLLVNGAAIFPSSPNTDGGAKPNRCVRRFSLGAFLKRVSPCWRRSSSAPSAAWTQNVRSRTLRQTLLIVFIYMLFWSPYNVLALLREVGTFEHWDGGGVDAYLGFLYSPIILNAVIDPLLYRFGG